MTKVSQDEKGQQSGKERSKVEFLDSIPFQRDFESLTIRYAVLIHHLECIIRSAFFLSLLAGDVVALLFHDRHGNVG